MASDRRNIYLAHENENEKEKETYMRTILCSGVGEV